MPLPVSILTASNHLKRPTLSLNDQAYERIKEKIISLELPPASLIDEARLASDLGMGLTPVRHALRKLAIKKLVIILPRRGTLVADLNTSDLQKIYELRIELEVLAAQLAAQRATPEEVQQLDRLAHCHLIDLTEGNNQELIELDREIHLLIANASQNEFLLETIEWLYNHIQRLWNLTIDKIPNLDDAIQEHKELCDAISVGNATMAGELMRVHVTHFQKEVNRLLVGVRQ
ncbi:MAG: GntR family transcriptional regulator [Chloroflexota bacterium]